MAHHNLMAKPLHTSCKTLFLETMRSKKTETKNTAEEAMTEQTAAENQTDVRLEDVDAVNELENIKAELSSAKDQNLRLYAEFENYKRRNAKERLDLMGSANLELMSAMLPVVDDFERALKNIPKSDENESLYTGVELIYTKMLDTLKQKGLLPLKSSVGLPFDLETMEAITRIPATDASQNNMVVDELERGYQLGNKMLRYARVIVAQFAEPNA